ncbi:MAG TPA: phosphatidylinositol-specific phospholipase C/glycerophosphodiester phosphodiesterase family protein [Verrucomicrobiae bacterium]
MNLKLTPAIGPFFSLFWLCFFSAAEAADPKPLVHAHAHNDYEHAHPLFDALENGFCSVEADIWLTNGLLLVAHDLKSVQTNRTLQALYLDPLRERVKRYGGRVFANGPEFTLLIDVKSDAEKTYAALREALKPYAGMLTEFRTDATQTNAVTVILSGNRPQTTLAAESPRLAGIDGRLPDLEGGPSKHLIPLVSDNWRNHFQWRGVGAMPDEERIRLEEFVAKAHQQGRRLRLWAAPDNMTGWAELRRAGVDLINTDDLSGLRQFLLGP